ncbi:MAG TPA: hypothetical protein VMF14_10380 [Solirubrobacteraceae bacterium]|nr:hypothetical protein [Solirubrobacteraceae bacterium]
MDSHREPDNPREPDLTPEELASERRLLSLMRDIEQGIRAPRGLRRRVEAEARARGRPLLGTAPIGVRRGRRRTTTPGGLWGLRTATVVAAAAALLAVGVLLPGGPGTPSLSQAAALAGRGAAQPAPTPDPDDPGVKLSEQVGDVYFPNWTSTLGWRPTGLRHDMLMMHSAVTVYYRLGTGRLAYTILSAPALPQPTAQVTVEHGMTVRTLRVHRELMVTWRRDGSTCILTGTHVSAAQLRRLALTDPPPDPD